MRRVPVSLLTACFLATLLFFGAGQGSADSVQNEEQSAERNEPLLGGLSNHHHPVTTASPLAQRYLDQGLNLVYAFNHDEAISSFEQAARLDPNMAMAYWGIALALGPNYNLPADAEQRKRAYQALGKAIALASHTSAAERAYIDALAKRYSKSPGTDPEALNQAYADAMRELAHRYPDDDDAQTLFAESMMDLRPWELWSVDGKPAPGTAEIISTLQLVLARNPLHPGANHYYIHAVEPSPHPESGLKCASRLAEIAPGAGHLVHMPTHIFMRVGRYHDVSLWNARAVTVDEEYIRKYKPRGIYPVIYYPHNVDFMLAGLMTEGRGRESLQAARKLAAIVPIKLIQEMPMGEFFVPRSLFAMARFERWDLILKEPAPPSDLPFATGIWHYARALAFIAGKQLEQAEKERATLRKTVATIPSDRPIGDHSRARDVLKLALKELDGRIAAAHGHTDEAIADLRDAVRSQDGLPYEAPPLFYYPVRQTLGAVLLGARRAGEAEMVYTEDLRQNPDNGWSLYGLMTCLRARGKQRAAAAARKRYERAWRFADFKLTAPEYALFPVTLNPSAALR